MTEIPPPCTRPTAMERRRHAVVDLLAAQVRFAVGKLSGASETVEIKLLMERLTLLV